MEIATFGIITVTNKGLEINYGGTTSYFIAKERLWEHTDRDNHRMWDWLIHLVEKTWMNKEDIMNLNIAFFFAQDYFSELAPNEDVGVSTAQTLYVQKQMKENHDKIAKIKSPKDGLSIPPDFPTEEYLKKCNQVREPIKYLDIST